MNKKLITSVTASLLLALPALILAATLVPEPTTYSGDLPVVISNIISLIWPVFAGFSVIMFIVAAFLFITAQGEPGKVSKAKDAVIYGSVGVVVALISFSIPFIIKVALGL